MSNDTNAHTTSTAQNYVKQRILVVDDVEENREILSYYLRKAGFDVVTASDGYNAVEGLIGGATRRRGGDQPPPFDLVLMDMQMPRIDGYEAVRKLRSSNFRTPIIAVTAHTLTGDREKCIAAGCDDYIGKPVDADKLIARCQSLISQARSKNAA